ncbi:hypothetical protein Pcinc_035293 [Petrolisthes cinctipes]|uniref:Uncharacterized protein n=1 Tax=Petrolisthes cinctipes TaxID=88211 RepID=A0AAE1BYL2_PETCI|nr:hypothetical protein Pcinc_035293 [Petrolisthes cinctipes]
MVEEEEEEEKEEDEVVEEEEEEEEKEEDEGEKEEEEEEKEEDEGEKEDVIFRILWFCEYDIERMGMMGTMLSNYPRTPHDGGPLGMVVSVLGAPDPVGGGPVQAWNATFSHHKNQNPNKVSKGSRVFPWTKGTKTVNAIKDRREGWMERGKGMRGRNGIMD